MHSNQFTPFVGRRARLCDERLTPNLARVDDPGIGTEDESTAPRGFSIRAMGFIALVAGIALVSACVAFAGTIA